MAHREQSTNGNRNPGLLDVLRKEFAEIVERFKPPLSAVMRGEFDEGLRPLFDRARVRGWSEDQARAAIVELAREYEGARAATFD